MQRLWHGASASSVPQQRCHRLCSVQQHLPATSMSSAALAMAAWAKNAARGFAAAAESGQARKVVVLGAAGGIGQPLSLLLKVCVEHASPAQASAVCMYACMH